MEKFPSVKCIFSTGYSVGGALLQPILPHCPGVRLQNLEPQYTITTGGN